jgi:hypothetical protein
MREPQHAMPALDGTAGDLTASHGLATASRTHKTHAFSPAQHLSAHAVNRVDLVLA